jgi:hypothetical protein
MKTNQDLLTVVSRVVPKYKKARKEAPPPLALCPSPVPLVLTPERAATSPYFYFVSHGSEDGVDVYRLLLSSTEHAVAIVNELVAINKHWDGVEVRARNAFLETFEALVEQREWRDNCSFFSVLRARYGANLGTWQFRKLEAYGFALPDPAGVCMYYNGDF